MEDGNTIYILDKLSNFLIQMSTENFVGVNAVFVSAKLISKNSPFTIEMLTNRCSESKK